jgi:pyridoxal phosphate enzyme (YggS family)
MIEQQLSALRQQIDRVDRPFTHPVEVIPVTKGFDGTAIEAAAAAGCSTVGENYAQDLLSKADTIRRLGIEVQFIGQLQSNKVRQLVDVVTLWATVDRRSIVDEIAKRAPGARVLIQVNATSEAGKGGCSPDDVADLIGHARDAGLQVEGLLTVGPTGQSPEAARPAFTAVRELVDLHGLEVCSMGMSGDLEIAVACGATQVRVGSALFGPRPPRD